MKKQYFLSCLRIVAPCSCTLETITERTGERQIIRHSLAALFLRYNMVDFKSDIHQSLWTLAIGASALKGGHRFRP